MFVYQCSAAEEKGCSWNMVFMFHFTCFVPSNEVELQLTGFINLEWHFDIYKNLVREQNNDLAYFLYYKLLQSVSHIGQKMCHREKTKNKPISRAFPGGSPTPTLQSPSTAELSPWSCLNPAASARYFLQPPCLSSPPLLSPPFPGRCRRPAWLSTSSLVLLPFNRQISAC